MTYGTNDGASVPVVKTSPQKPQPYQGGLYTDSSKGHIDPSTVPSAPAVPPPQGSSGSTSVDTSSLRKFADNLDTIADMLGDARNKVAQMPDLAAGAFKQAEDLAAVVTGAKVGAGGGTDSSASSSSSSGSGSGSGSGASASSSGTDDSIDGLGGLRGNYHNALHDLRQVLMDTAQNVRTLAGRYSTIEEINQKAGKDLSRIISTAEQDLQPLMNDQF
ncbi:hypothetical protein ABZ832_17370 [Streptantibioticus parmotrematis]|uniref:hypothetical protein n=1 Tax=Streptantibioticus parmotrematis TaxID=2873249 RepID=UPI0034111AF5